MDSSTRDLLLSWAATGALAGFLVYLMVRPVNAGSEWAVIVLAAIATWIGLYLAYHAFMRGVDRRAAAARAELARIDRFVRSLTVDEAKALVARLIDAGVLHAELRPAGTPTVAGLPPAVAEVFREHRSIATVSEGGISEEAIEEQGDLLVIGTDAEELYMPFGLRSDGRWVHRQLYGPDEEWPSPWHWLAADANYGADAERWMSEFPGASDKPQRP